MKHLFDEIRAKVYWALSNVSASEAHYNLVTELIN